MFYKASPPFLSVPIDVSFYSPASGKAEFQTLAEETTAAPIKQNDENAKTLLRKIEQENKMPAEKEDIEAKNEKETAVAPPQDANRTVGLNKTNTQTKAAGNAVPVASSYDGVSFDSADFNYGYYTNSIIRTISAYWTWAESYGSLRTIVFFRIAKDGSISSVEIKKTSGNSRFDLNAVNAVKRAGKFAPLPDGYKHNSLGVYFEFKYRG